MVGRQQALMLSQTAGMAGDFGAVTGDDDLVEGGVDPVRRTGSIRAQAAWAAGLALIVAS